MMNEAEDDRDVHRPMLSACIRDLMRCVVVMQIEDRSRPEIKGYDIYDRVRVPYSPGLNLIGRTDLSPEGKHH
jgi:hypothetical protein